MKKISKGPQPTELIKWTADNRKSVNFKFPNLPSKVKSAIKRSLVAEQGGLCCYTGCEIDEAKSHIEHLKPQNKCRRRGEDVKYDNLLAAYPGPGMRDFGFGARAKGSWFDHRMVSPLHPNCERRFRFGLLGDIEAANGSDAGAKETISRLALDNSTLVGWRRGAIEAFTSAGHDLSLPEIDRLIRRMDQRNGAGKFEPFCFAIKRSLQVFKQKRKRKKQRHRFVTFLKKRLSKAHKN